MSTLTYTPELVAIVRQILAHPEGMPWTLQGLGMLRCDLAGREYRLHVWDKRYMTPGASTIHDHPWDLESMVLSGLLTNILYSDEGTATGCRHPDCFDGGYKDYHSEDHTHWCNVIEPGQHGNELEPPAAWHLEETVRTVYGPGETYSQLSTDIHETTYRTGTVTIVRRTNRDTDGDRGDKARVLWPVDAGPTWGEATPRAATPERVRDICTVALAMWGED
jgi:hypothetical protein